MWDMSILFTLAEPSVHNTWGCEIPVLPWQRMWCYMMCVCSKRLFEWNHHETSHLAAIRRTELVSLKGESCGTILLFHDQMEPPKYHNIIWRLRDNRCNVTRLSHVYSSLPVCGIVLLQIVNQTFVRRNAGPVKVAIESKSTPVQRYNVRKFIQSDSVILFLL